METIQSLVFDCTGVLLPVLQRFQQMPERVKRPLESAPSIQQTGGAQRRLESVATSPQKSKQHRDRALRADPQASRGGISVPFETIG